MPPPRASIQHVSPVLIGAIMAAQALLAVLDIVASSDVVLTTAYLLPPLALALVAAPRLVALAGAASFALAVASGGWNDFFLTADHVTRITIVAGAAVLAVLGARLRRTALAAIAQTGAAHRAADASRRQLDAMLGALAEAVTVHDRRGKTVYANGAALALLGVTAEELRDAEPGELAARFRITYEDGSPVAVEDLPGRRAVLGEEAPGLLTRTVDVRSGRARWLLTKATVVEAERGEPLAVNVIEDVTAAKESELRQRYLAEVGRALAFALEPATALERIARLTVPVLADWCAIDLVDDTGALRPAALAQREPVDPEQSRQLRERLSGDPGVRSALVGGQPHLRSEITDEGLRALGLRSALVAPMRVGERTLGVITLLAAAGGQSYDARDVAFASDVALRVAVSIDNMRLSAERAEAATTLQRSLLPDRLPDLDGLRAAASYDPGERGSEVGGDFYDVFTAGGDTLVVLGDVTGKGVRAAALTALVRHTARTAARFDSRPGAVLAVVDEVLREQAELSLVSSVCARLRPTSEGIDAEIAVGGHPLPLRLGAGGHLDAVGRGSVLLGARPDGSWPVDVVRLTPGDTLVFYTDGATDVPGRDERFGEERLRQVVAAGPADPDAVVARVNHAVERFRVGSGGDDRALLAVQYVGAAVRCAGG